MIRVYPTATGRIIRWSESDNAVTLERSIHSSSNFSPIADVLGRIVYYDNQYIPEALNVMIWYQLITQDGKVIGPARIVNLQDKIAEAMADRIRQHVEGFGVPIAVAQVRVGGKKCSRCFSTSTNKTVDRMCPVCYGTGWEGGYFEPVFTKAIKVQQSERTLKSITPVVQFPNASVFVLSSDVPVSPKDIIADFQTGGIYRVQSVKETIERNTALSQTVIATLLPLEAPEYSLPGLKDYEYKLENIPGSKAQTDNWEPDVFLGNLIKENDK